MPSLKAVRRRILSVKSTQKITRAMKLVAAARLRRAQEEIIAARPYSDALGEAVAQIAARAGADAHPMLTQRPGNRTALVVLTSDRGLAGAFNSGVSRAAQTFIETRRCEGTADGLRLEVVGRKGREYLKRRRYEIAHEFAGTVGETALDRAREIALTVTEEFLTDQIDAVTLVYNEFRSAISQRVTFESLLPVKPAPLPDNAGQIDFVYEPNETELLNLVMPLYIQSRVHRAILESIASEFGAKMTAMDNATKNAKEMIGSLTLQYNRARQAAITKELMEIVGGAEALKG